MRDTVQNKMDNVLNRMFNVNRGYIEQEIGRMGSVGARDTDYRRNGMLNFGARQMMNLVDDPSFMIIGSVSGSPIVGP